MKRYHYKTSCVNSTAEAINSMTEQATDVTLATLRRHCVGLREWEEAMKYDVGNQRGGLRLKNDWAVNFHKSIYEGKPCYYIQHSRIEYIWVKKDKKTKCHHKPDWSTAQSAGEGIIDVKCWGCGIFGSFLASIDEINWD